MEKLMFKDNKATIMIYHRDVNLQSGCMKTMGTISTRESVI